MAVSTRCLGGAMCCQQRSPWPPYPTCCSSCHFPTVPYSPLCPPAYNQCYSALQISGMGAAGEGGRECSRECGCNATRLIAAFLQCCCKGGEVHGTVFPPLNVPTSLPHLAFYPFLRKRSNHWVPLHKKLVEDNF